MKSSVLLLLFVLCVCGSGLSAQGGISIAPGKLFFNQLSDESQTRTVELKNPTDETLEVQTLIQDWYRERSGKKNYRPAGTLEQSCSPYLEVIPERQIVPPGETRLVTVRLVVPASYTPEDGVLNSMIFFRQTRPYTPSTNTPGGVQSDIKVLFQVGVHAYYSHPALQRRGIELQNLRYENGQLIATLANVGEVLLEAVLNTELTDLQTGKEIKLPEAKALVSLLPGDLRDVVIDPGKGVPPGAYSALVSVDIGAEYDIEVGIIEIEY